MPTGGHIGVVTKNRVNIDGLHPTSLLKKLFLLHMGDGCSPSKLVKWKQVPGLAVSIVTDHTLTASNAVHSQCRIQAGNSYWLSRHPLPSGLPSDADGCDGRQLKGRPEHQLLCQHYGAVQATKQQDKKHEKTSCLY